MIGDPSPTWETDDDTTPEQDLLFLMSDRTQPAPTVLFLLVLSIALSLSLL